LSIFSSISFNTSFLSISHTLSFRFSKLNSHFRFHHIFFEYASHKTTIIIQTTIIAITLIFVSFISQTSYKNIFPAVKESIYNQTVLNFITSKFNQYNIETKDKIHQYIVIENGLPNISFTNIVVIMKRYIK
jgi:hypothetical protein